MTGPSENTADAVGARASCETGRWLAALEPDEALSEYETRLLREHTRRCDACATFATQVRALTALLRNRTW